MVRRWIGFLSALSLFYTSTHSTTLEQSHVVTELCFFFFFPSTDISQGGLSIVRSEQCISCSLYFELIYIVTCSLVLVQDKKKKIGETSFKIYYTVHIYIKLTCTLRHFYNLFFKELLWIFGKPLDKTLATSASNCIMNFSFLEWFWSQNCNFMRKFSFIIFTGDICVKRPGCLDDKIRSQWEAENSNLEHLATGWLRCYAFFLQWRFSKMKPWLI